MQTDSAKRSASTVRSALLAGVLVTAIALVANVGSDAADSESRLGETLVAPTPMAQESPPSANDTSSQGAMDQADEFWAKEMPSRPPPAPLPPEVMALRETVVATPAERVAEEARMTEVARNFDE